MEDLEVAGFYRFAPLPDYVALRPAIEAACRSFDVRGTVLLAPEGINATLAGAPDRLSEAIAGIEAVTGLRDLDIRRTRVDRQPFGRLRVRLKREIVTLGDVSADPSLRTGTAVDAADWNAVLLDPDVLVIDVRNAFEVEMGSFAGALDPRTPTFGAFPAFVREALTPARHRRVAMFCTGGIRCEKASSFMLAQGFPDVLQLKGGILAYLAEVPPEKSLWRGRCFVFDGREALGCGLLPAGSERSPMPSGQDMNRA